MKGNLEYVKIKQWVKVKITRKMKKHFGWMKTKNTIYQNLACSEGRAHREMCSCKHLHLKRKIFLYKANHYWFWIFTFGFLSFATEWFWPPSINKELNWNYKLIQKILQPFSMRIFFLSESQEEFWVTEFLIYYKCDTLIGIILNG